MKKLKKNLLFLFIAVLLGAFVGDYITTNYGKSIPVLNRNDSFYILQEGVYNSEEQMQDNVKNLFPKIVINRDNKYHVYVGITKSEEVLEKLFNIYKDLGYTIYTKEEDINNVEFIKLSTELDELIKTASDNTEILKIEELVLSSYEQKISK